MFKNPSVLVKTRQLIDLDPSGEAKISFKQADTLGIQQRDQEAFAQQSRSFTDDAMLIKGDVPITHRMEIEARLTICEPTVGILNRAGEPAFKFSNGKLAMSADEFHIAWGEFDPAVTRIFWLVCLDANPEWDYRVARPTTPASNAEADQGLVEIETS